MKIKYAPPGPVSAAFMQSEAFVRGIRGPVGSGKTTACIFEMIRRAAEQRPGPDGRRKTRWVVIRNTYTELKTTTIKSWHQWMPSSIGMWKGEGPPTHHIIDGTFDMEVIFLALDRPDDIKKLLSLEVTGGWINEAREVPKAVLDALTGRVGRFPSALEGGASWFGVLMDTNPPDSDHWWYRLAEEERPSDFAFFAQPGGMMLSDDGKLIPNPGAENVENLPPGYYQRLCQGKDADWILVYVRAQYGFVKDGKPVYSDFVDSVHVRAFDLVPEWGLRIGVDFGLTPAATFSQRSPLGQWRTHRELVAQDMGAVRFAEELKRVMAQHYQGIRIDSIACDPAGDGRAQTDERTPIQILRAANIQAEPAPTNDLTQRLEAVSVCLRRLVDGQPGFLLHPQCTVLRKGFGGGYAFKRVQVSGDERYRDEPNKNRYSHPHDALQYSFIAGGEGLALISAPERDTTPVVIPQTVNHWNQGRR